MATLGGTTIVNQPTPETRGNVFVGNQRRSLNGGMITSYIARKMSFEIKMVMLTQLQRATAYTQYTNALSASQTYVDPDGVSFTVVAIGGSWTETMTEYAADILYDIGFTVEEV